MYRCTLVSVIAAVSALTLMTGSTTAATSTTSTRPPDQCAAVHMVLVNGTFDTAPGIDPNADHGFYAQVATKAMERANDGTALDKSAGIQAPVVEDLTPTAIAETTHAQEPQRSGSNTVSADLPGGEVAAWEPQTATGTATPSLKVGGDLWMVTTTEPDVVDGEDTVAPTTSPSSQWPLDTDEEQTEENTQRIARTYITYPATAGGAYVPGIHQPPSADSTSYADSMATGVDNAKSVLDQIERECPGTKVFISGYSQGAQVASTVLRDIGAGEGPVNPQMVAGGALMSDPTRADSAPLISGGTATPTPAPGTRGIAVRQLGPVGSEDIVPGGGIAVDHSALAGEGFGALNGRVASYCLPGDLVCAMPVQSPLPKLVTSVAEEVNLNDPVGSLRAIAETLGPAVVLGGVESVSEGVSFGPRGFQISRASNPHSTLLGRIATETQRADRDPGEMEQRLVAGITTIGGMALGAGITIAREVVTPANIAQIAAAGIAGPQAAGAVAIAKLAESSMKLITPELLGGASRRVMDEVQAAGLNEDTLTTVATQAAQWNAQNAHAGYASVPVTPDGRTAAEATSDWAVALAADAVAGTDRQLDAERVAPTLSTARMVEFDQDSATNALSQLLEVAQTS